MIVFELQFLNGSKWSHLQERTYYKGMLRIVLSLLSFLKLEVLGGIGINVLFLERVFSDVLDDRPVFVKYAK